MAKRNVKVDYGYEDDDLIFKGTLFVIDSFENFVIGDLTKIINVADDRKFDKIIFYPLHEQTLKRMEIEVTSKYFDRLKRLENLIIELNTDIPISINKLDGKRKRYTPIDFILSHLSEASKKPHFVYMSNKTANKFSNYSSFPKWISELRLIVNGGIAHGNLGKFKKRIDFI